MLTGEPPLEGLVIPKLLEDRAARLGESPYFSFAGTTYSYRETHARAAGIATALEGIGIGPGTKVCLMAENSAEILFAWLGLAGAGALVFWVNPAMRGPILRRTLAHAGVEVVFVGERVVQHVADVAAELPALRHVVLVGSQEPVGDTISGRRASRFEELSAGRSASFPHRAAYYDPIQVIQTSGTTGTAKGVLMSHAHLCRMSLSWMDATGLTQADKMYVPVQLFHANASYGVTAALLAGCSLTLADKFHASTFWETVGALGTTVALASVSLYSIFMQRPQTSQERSHRVRSFWQTPSSRPFEQRFGVRSACGYGTTETGLVFIGRYDDEKRPEGSSGRANERFYDVAILDEQDNRVPADTWGEIVVRPSVPYSMMLGYYGNPDATLTTWRNLWHHTGDLGRIDADGYFYFKSRKKDVIRRRGENIAASDVEEVFLSHPAIAECAAIPYPSAISEDEIRVVIVPRPGSQLEPADLIAFCEPRMPGYMIPRYVEFREQLPRTFHNRIEKYRLQEEGLGADAWDRETG